MKTPNYWVISILSDIAIVIVVLFIMGAALFSSEAQSAELGGNTDCVEWADFTKVVTMRFRDTGAPKEVVIARFQEAFPGNPEVLIAIDWIKYTYDHPNTDPVAMWKEVYESCYKGDI